MLLIGSAAVLSAIAFALGVYAEFGRLWGEIRGFQWELLPLLVLLTCINYAFCYLRWEYLLSRVGGETYPRYANIKVFFSGGGLILTPGRIGELSRSIYARELFGIPMSRSSPIMFTERIFDSLVMIGLAGMGTILFARGYLYLIIGGAATCILLILIFRNSLLWKLLPNLPIQIFRNRLAFALENAGSSFELLTSPGVAFIQIVLGTLAWGVECMTFAVVLSGLGMPLDTDLILKACVILPISTLLGNLSFLPAGLGVTEAGIVGLSQALLPMGQGQAAAAALIARCLVISGALIPGLVSLLLLRGDSSSTSRNPSVPVEPA